MKFQADPGKYEPSHNLSMNKTLSYHFGSEKRPEPGYKSNRLNPSPDRYNIPSRIVEGAKCMMHSKLNQPNMNSVPGAGTYNTQNLGNLN